MVGRAMRTVETSWNSRREIRWAGAGVSFSEGEREGEVVCKCDRVYPVARYGGSVNEGYLVTTVSTPYYNELGLIP